VFEFKGTSIFEGCFLLIDNCRMGFDLSFTIPESANEGEGENKWMKRRAEKIWEIWNCAMVFFLMPMKASEAIRVSERQVH